MVNLPFSDYSNSKLRPVLVVSSDTINFSSKDVVVAKITSSEYSQLHEVKLTRTMLSSGELAKESFIDLSVIFTVEKKLILKKIGSINKKSIVLCDEKLKNVFGI